MRSLSAFGFALMGRFRVVFLASLLFSLAFIALGPRYATASDTETGSNVNVAKGETINDDLVLAGGDVVIDGTVKGDVTGAASTLKVNGRVQGDINVAAGKIDITGTVDQSVRAVGGKVTISGAIGGDLVLVGGNVDVEKSGRVAGDLLAIGGDVTLNGPVNGSVKGNYGDLTINARVGQDVRVRVDNLSVENGARIAGDVSYRSRDEADFASGSVINGSIEHRRLVGFLPNENITFWVVSAVFRLLCALLAGLIVVLLMPRTTAAIADAARQSLLKSVLFGLIFLIAIPILLAILMVTIIGIPVALIGFALFVIALYLSQVFVGTALGRFILPDSWGNLGRGYNLLAMVIGVIIIAALRAIPVPYVGWIITVIVTILGIGAIAIGLSRRGRVPLGGAA
jgi:cytoskeletal protein CcmA (bactofilin family)